MLCRVLSLRKPDAVSLTQAKTAHVLSLALMQRKSENPNDKLGVNEW